MRLNLEQEQVLREMYDKEVKIYLRKRKIKRIINKLSFGLLCRTKLPGPGLFEFLEDGNVYEYQVYDPELTDKMSKVWINAINSLYKNDGSTNK